MQTAMDTNPKPLLTVAEQREADTGGAMTMYNISRDLTGSQLAIQMYLAGINAGRDEAVQDGGVTALRLTVWEALDNLSENITDQEMRDRSPAHEAIELSSYCAPLENYGDNRQHELLTHIRSWRRMVKGWKE